MQRTPDLTVTVLMRRIDLLEAEAETDRLTKLGNELMLERRATARGGWFVAIDLNNFKRAQDTHPDGHAYGDSVLFQFADFLRSITRDTERVAVRPHGDEFVVWCPDRLSAARVKRSVRGWYSKDGRVSASAGIGEDLIIADANMYLRKRVRKKVMHGQT